MTKQQLLESISSQELAEWTAYFKVLNEENESDKDKWMKEKKAHEQAKRGAN